MRKLRAFTLVELLVVIGIIALLISILLPTLGRARKSANSVKCLSNLRQVGTAFQLYAADFRGKFPVVRQDTPDNTGQPGGPSAATFNIWWTDTIAPYVSKVARATSSTATSLDEVRQTVLWGCPEWTGRNATLNQYDTGYGMNGQVTTMPDYPTPTTPGYPNTPKEEYAMRWLPATYPGKYYSFGSVRMGAERVLVADSVIWFLNANATAGNVGEDALPGQPLNPSTLSAAVTRTPKGLMDFDMFRHGKISDKDDGTYRKFANGKVACNAVYFDGHAETITGPGQAYRSIFMKAP
jgi:prepilin-type N-terminal cleavage/methylation domain-containing protein/prepilin-type processing-associated H-X9-DG protein